MSLPPNFVSVTSPAAPNSDRPRNDQVALRWYRLAADQGNSEAEEKIGDLYWQGSADLPRDRAEAVRHFSVAADRGLASGARKLAIAYANGDGVPRGRCPDVAVGAQGSRRLATRWPRACWATPS